MAPRRAFAPFFLALAALVGCAVQAPPSESPHAHHHPQAGGETFVAGGEALVSFKRDVVPVLRLHCAGCHTAPTAEADAVALFDAAGNPDHAVVQAHIGQMLLELQTGRMPMGEPYSVPPEQFRLLDVWGASGTPEN